MSVRLKPRWERVVVVFGASTGIGRVTALEACRRGARVVAAARGDEGLASLAEEAGAPDRFAVEVADAADPRQVQAVADAAVARYGRLDTWAHVVYPPEVVVGGAGKASF